jgi:hypothetical protein
MDSGQKKATRGWYKARQRELRQIMWEWDPLGILGVADDEYDCVIDPVLSALARGYTAAHIRGYSAKSCFIWAASDTARASPTDRGRARRSSRSFNGSRRGGGPYLRRRRSVRAGWRGALVSAETEAGPTILAGCAEECGHPCRRVRKPTLVTSVRGGRRRRVRKLRAFQTS